ncbi:MAG: hypothetical protein JWO25_1621 [Alphaproteobacteria bacterium]|nr:hypothetical protein [Alphaproteobacteria bacterium]MDB5722388.1 hypothetical protein [Alphaproteobacteria bacterium]
MHPLHMSKVAVSCASLETLQRRQALRLVDGEVPLLTRFRPKRADELIGGSLYWIIKHRLVARQTILGFDLRTSDRRTVIRLSPEIVRVEPVAKRAHQGWRYLVVEDAPRDLGGDETGLADLPPALASKLSMLMLI